MNNIDKEYFPKRQYCFISSKKSFPILNDDFKGMKLISKTKIGKKYQYYFSRESIHYFYNVTTVRLRSV